MIFPEILIFPESIFNNYDFSGKIYLIILCFRKVYVIILMFPERIFNNSDFSG
uniref:Uncharacterized protein n=1 Tax=Meloidogyne enterolobii TaxID=390850 RepID=A0A6V7X237_MELEN|nr:unnamed protein product [Meloidogyne enterolobii]